jgi:hypothetical protein
MKNLQTLHISNPLSSLSCLSLLSFFSKNFFLFPALILLFVVQHHRVLISHPFYFWIEYCYLCLSLDFTILFLVSNGIFFYQLFIYIIINLFFKIYKLNFESTGKIYHQHLNIFVYVTHGQA